MGILREVMAHKLIFIETQVSVCMWGYRGACGVHAAA